MSRWRGPIIAADRSPSCQAGTEARSRKSQSLIDGPVACRKQTFAPAWTKVRLRAEAVNGQKWPKADRPFLARADTKQTFVQRIRTVVMRPKPRLEPLLKARSAATDGERVPSPKATTV